MNKELIFKNNNPFKVDLSTPSGYKDLFANRCKVWTNGESQEHLGLDLKELKELQDFMMVRKLQAWIKYVDKNPVSYSLMCLLTSPDDLHALPEVILPEEINNLDDLFGDINGSPTNNVILLNGVGTVPKHRGKGYASEVIAAREAYISEFAKANNAKFVLIYTWVGNRLPKACVQGFQWVADLDPRDPSKIFGYKSIDLD